MQPLIKVRVRWRYLALGGGLIITAVIIGWFIAKVQIQEGSGLHFEHKYYDAGTICSYDKRVVRHQFPFRNTGKKTLRITNIKTTCGCAVVEKPEGEFAPQEEGFLDVTLTIGALGQQSGNILVYPSDSNSPVLIKIVGAFEPKTLTEALPKKLKFGGLGLEESDCQMLSINAFSKTSDTVRIEQVESKFNLIEKKVIATTRPEYRNLLGYYRTTFQLEVSPRSSNSESFEDHLTVSFDLPIFPSVEIPISGRVTPKFVLHPHKAFFILSSGQKQIPRSKTLVLRHAKKEKLAVQSVNNPFSSWLNVQVITSDDATKVKIMLEPILSPQSLNGNLELVIQDENNMPETVEIPIAVRIL